MNVEVPEHLRGVIWAYDEDARAIVCLLTGKGFSLPWLERARWDVTHERLRDGLPSARTRLEYLGPAPGSPAGKLLSAKGEPLKLRHG